MTENTKNFLLILLVPGLLACEVLTGMKGFYNVAAFIIVLYTLILAVALGLLYWMLNRPELNPTKFKIAEKPSKLLINFSRIVSILTTIYLVWVGHFIIGLIDFVSLILSIVVLAVVTGIQDAVREYHANEHPIEKLKRELDEFKTR